MKITNCVPKDWKDLQNKVCKFLNEAGYNAESPKTIETVRGSVEVDVFAESEDELLRQFICECKFWDSSVPKEKVHAFRTVVNDSGSMVGIMIAKSGFQSGAYEAAYCSNVLLKNWEGFIELIGKKWLKERTKTVKRNVSPISVYSDFLDVPIEKLPCEKRRMYDELTVKCFNAFMICRDIAGTLKYKNSVEVDGITFDAYDELYDYCEKECLDAIAEYKKIFEDNPIDERKFEGWGHMLFHPGIEDEW